MFKLSLAVTITAMMILVPLYAHALVSPNVLTPTIPHFYDLNGNRLDSLEEGRQVMIATMFSSSREEEVPFVGIIEIRDANDISVFLAWQSGTVESHGNKTISVSWLVQNSTAYQSRTFFITNFENPQVLSPVESYEVQVRQI